MSQREASPASEIGDARLPAEVCRTLIASLPDGVLVCSRDGVIVYANGQLCEMFGYGDDALVGATVEELLPPASRAAHSANRLRFVAEPRTRPMGLGIELWGQRRDGSEFPVEIALSYTGAGTDLLAIATVRDVTARHEAEAQLRAVLRLVERLHEAVFVLDRTTFRYTYANRGAEEMTGYTEADLLTMTPLHIHPDLDEVALAATFARPPEGNASAARERLVLRRRDGSETHVELIVDVSAADRRGENDVFVILHDISERLANEAQRQAGLELQARLADRERIARDLHDTVIQELFGVGLSLHAAAARCDEATRVKIFDAVERQDQIIREIRTAIFGMTVHQRGSDGLVDQALVVVDDAARMLGFRPSFRTDGPLDTVVAPETVDQLVPALRELLSNAARHAEATRVAVDLECSDADVTLTVVDNGVGFTDERRAGNGLRNLRSRAEELGGTVTVTSNPGDGTRVELTVPVAAAE